MSVLDDEEGAQAEQERGQCADLPNQTESRRDSCRRGSEDFDPFRPLMIDIEKQTSQQSEVHDDESQLSENLNSNQAISTPPRPSLDGAAIFRQWEETHQQQNINNILINKNTSHDSIPLEVNGSLQHMHPGAFVSGVDHTMEHGHHLLQTSPSMLTPGGHYDSTPGSRVASPASSVHSTPTSAGRGKGSAPNKARRKHDRILPVSSGGEEKYVCPVCKLVLNCATELTKHIRSHNQVTTSSTINSCTICNKVLSSQSSLDRHMLVHSGERPFKCKLCKMAFTTNGNMHRHMRIHEKELEGNSLLKELQPLTPRPRGRRRNQDKELEQRFVQAYNQELNSVSVKRKLSLSSSDGGETPVQTPTFGLKEEIICKQPSFVNYDAVPLDPGLRTEVPALPSVPIKGDEKEKKGDDEVTCPVCTKTFLCKYGLETHMETHPEYRLQCYICSQNFSSRQALFSHNQSAHQQYYQQNHMSQGGQPSDHPPNGLRLDALPVGFHDLDFYEFSCVKFPLVAKAWCEKNPRQTGSKYHDFTCHDCDRSFPCRSALNMHKDMHSRKNGGRCLECDTNFPSTKSEFQHKLQHVGEKVVETITNMEMDEEELLNSAVSKQEFLAVLDLHVSHPVKNDENYGQSKENLKEFKHESRPMGYEDKKINKDYFVMLGQAASRARNSFEHVQNNRSSGDLAGIPQLLKLTSQANFDQRNTMLHHDVIRPIPQFMSMAPSPAATFWSGGTMINMAAAAAATLPSQGAFQHQLQAGTNGYLPSITGEENSSKEFKCEICSDMFNNDRAYKSHMKNHMGLAPYKCELCPYSSTDKSTLVRHMRTHNGERPFQCKLCEFAFTTKANCERHVRKRHEIENKGRIEASIGYSHYSNSTMSLPTMDAVCRSCGNDFETLSELRLHLRSPLSGCEYKPFSCRLCFTNFSAHTTCVQHILKMHPAVDSGLLEEHVNVDRIMVAQIARLECTPVNPLNEEASRSTSQAANNPINIHPAFGLQQFNSFSKSRQGAVQMPVSGMPMRYIAPPRGLVPHVRQPPKTFITSPPILNITPDPNLTGQGYDEPLDFSMKPKKPAASVDPKPTLAPLYPTIVTEMDGPVDLTRSAPKEQPAKELQVHIRSHTNERPFQCDFCSAGFTIKTNLDRHLKTRHQQNGECVTSEEATVIQDSEEEEKSEKNNNDISMLTNNSKTEKTYLINERPHSTPACYDTGYELAPVKRLLAASNLNTFHKFLNSSKPSCEQKTKHAISSDPLIPATVEEGLMKKRRLELDHMTQCTPSNLDLQDNHSRDSVSPTGSLGKTSPDGDFLKKKRNSYADSPHKLICPYCPRAFPWISSLNRHILTHTGQKPFKCPRCPVMFSTKSNRERHLIRKHGLNVLDPSTRQMMDRPFKCHLCVFSSFSTSSNLKKHYAEKHPDAVIPEHLLILPPGMEDIYNDASSLASDMSEGRHSYTYEEEEDDDPLEDSLGGKPNEQLTAAQESNMGFPTSRGPTPTPSTTPRDTPPGTPDNTHQKHINPERDNYNVDKITDCWKCGQNFPSRKSLLRHLKDHNIDLPFKCYLCDASFETRLECLEHKVAQHTHDWELLREKNKVENVEEFALVVNTIVEQNFLQAEGGSMDSHMAAKLNLGDGDLKPESDYQQRKVYCTLCPKRFWSLQDLRRHMRSHTGERPFECDICQKRFTLKHSMMRHKRKHLSPGMGTPDISDDEGSIAEDSVDYMRLPVSRPMHRQSPLSLPSGNLGPKSYAASSLILNADQENGERGDLLHNLLGVENTAIDKMLESSDLESARKLLGVKH